MRKTLKAGCILINLKDKTIALVYRENNNDYTFPKGHLENNETILECAIRETEEETKRKCIIIEEEPISIEKYVNNIKEDVELYYYLCLDNGPSDNNSIDTHPTIWIDFDEVYDKLTYDTQKETWNKAKDKIKNIFMKNSK